MVTADINTPNAPDLSTIYSDYDSIIQIVCPNYNLFLNVVANNLSNAGRIVNLGAGSGNLEQRIFVSRPNVKIYGLDLDADLLNLAQDKLIGYNFSPLQGDIFKIPWPECDAIVSSITIHHFTDAEKEKLFRRIYSHLPKSGAFINYDYTLPKNKAEKEKVYASIKNNMLEYGFKEEIINKLREETEKKDNPMLLEKQKILLENLGFDFQLLHTELSFAVYKCVK